MITIVNKKPLLCLFIGIAMTAISLIILYVFIINPSTALIHMVPEQPDYDNCIAQYTDIYDDSIVNNSSKPLDEGEQSIVKTICDIGFIDYDRNDTTVILLMGVTGWLLIIGVPLTIGGIIWLIVSKIKERRRKKEKEK